nr:hypothetical protein [Deferribacter autotrophicus]
MKYNKIFVEIITLKNINAMIDKSLLIVDFLLNLSMKEVISNVTLCGHSQPHHILPNSIVIRMKRNVKKRKKIRIVKKLSILIVCPKKKSFRVGISNLNALLPLILINGNPAVIIMRTVLTILR